MPCSEEGPSPIRNPKSAVRDRLLGFPVAVQLLEGERVDRLQRRVALPGARGVMKGTKDLSPLAAIDVSTPPRTRGSGDSRPLWR